jgi:hypothetical protein
MLLKELVFLPLTNEVLFLILILVLPLIDGFRFWPALVNFLTAIHCSILLPLQKIDTVAALQFTDPFSNGSLFAYIVVKMRPSCVPWPHAGSSLDEQAAAGGSSVAAAAHRAIAGRSRCGLCHRREWRLRAVWPPDKQGGGRPEQRRPLLALPLLALPSLGGVAGKLRSSCTSPADPELVCVFPCEDFAVSLPNVLLWLCTPNIVYVNFIFPIYALVQITLFVAFME